MVGEWKVCLGFRIDGPDWLGLFGLLDFLGLLVLLGLSVLSDLMFLFVVDFVLAVVGFDNFHAFRGF